ncbi:MAG: carbohydrate ABC transporter permease [Acholeplasmatales bacterium]|jgi:multiple sugar transport system permease protein|nr:carbohydrate ABC transporter permease [Acholeplasmatales bacterium]
MIKRRLSFKSQKLIYELSTKFIIYLSLLIFALWLIIPFSIIISTSFKTWQEAETIGFHFIPKEFSLDGYLNALSYGTESYGISILLRGFINTLLYVVPTTLIGLFVSSLAGFGFAKTNFKGKKVMFTCMIATMLIPGTIMIAPTYIIYDKLMLVDTPIPIIVPGMFGAAACVFFMRQFYTSIPDGLIDAARIDGLSNFEIFIKIMIPLSKPALIAQGVLGFVGGYNDYFNPLIYLQSPKYYTLQIALRSFTGTYSNMTNALMAGSVLVLLPAFIIYIFAQKFFIEGVATTGMKL